jgi:hypothetical protein
MIAEGPWQGGFLQVIENKATTSARRDLIAVGIRVATVLASIVQRRWPERGKANRARTRRQRRSPQSTNLRSRS